MPRIDPLVIVHRLNVSPSFPPIRQKKRVFAQERDRAIVEEVGKLKRRALSGKYTIPTS